MAWSVDQPVRFGPDVLFRALGEQMVLVHLGDDRVYELNESAAMVWTKLSGGATPAEAATALVAAFDVTPVDATRAVSALLDTLEKAALIVE